MASCHHWDETPISVISGIMPATPSDVVSVIEAEAFRGRLDALGLSLTEFSARTGFNYRTVVGWGKPRNNGTDPAAFQPFPTWVSLLLREWETHGLPEWRAA